MSISHITIKQRGQEPRPHRCHADATLFTCPFCSTDVCKPRQYHQIMTHIAGHKLRAVEYGDHVIYSCYIGCGKTARHFHCCQCPKIYINKGALKKHLSSSHPINTCTLKPQPVSDPQEEPPSQKTASHPQKESPSQQPASQPQEPSSQKPASEPQEPSSQKPQEPSSQKPQEPSSQKPQEPSSQKPQEPSSQKPQEPSSQKPASQPQEPSSQKPQQETSSQKTSQPQETSSQITSQPQETSSQITSQPQEPSSQKPESQPQEPSSQKPASQPQQEPSSQQPQEPSSQKPASQPQQEPSSQQPQEPSSQKPASKPQGPSSQKTASQPQEPSSQKPQETSSQKTSQPQEPSSQKPQPGTSSQKTSQPQEPSSQKTSQPQEPSSQKPQPGPSSQKTSQPQETSSQKTSQPQEPSSQKTSQPQEPSSQKTSQPQEPSSQKTSQPQEPSSQKTSQPQEPSSQKPQQETSSQKTSQPQEPSSQKPQETSSQKTSQPQEPSSQKTSQPQEPSSQKPQETSSQKTSQPQEPSSQKPQETSSQKPQETSSQKTSQPQEPSCQKPASHPQQEPPSQQPASHPQQEPSSQKPASHLQQEHPSQQPASHPLQLAAPPVIKRISLQCRRRHITIKQRGQEPRPHRCHADATLFTCPFCSTDVCKPRQYHQIMTHIAGHKLRAVEYGDHVIYSCNIGCGKMARHFHCFQCPKTYINKSALKKHLCSSHPIATCTLKPQPARDPQEEPPSQKPASPPQKESPSQQPASQPQDPPSQQPSDPLQLAAPPVIKSHHRHITIKQRGQEPRPHRCHADATLFTCPFCSTDVCKPRQYHQIMTHIAGHKLRAVEYGDHVIYSCNIGCGKMARHFHCFQCPKTYINKADLKKHLRSSHPIATCTLKPQPGSNPQQEPPSEQQASQTQQEPPLQQPASPPLQLAAPPVIKRRQISVQCRRRHITIKQRGQDPQPQRCHEDTTLFTCPFCSTDVCKPRKYQQIMTHIARHKVSAVEYGDDVIYSCNSCGEKARHFHCCQCPQTYFNQGALKRHLCNTHPIATCTPEPHPVGCALQEPPLQQPAPRPLELAAQRVIVKRKQISVQCPHCRVSLNSKNLKMHIKRKHHEAMDPITSTWDSSHKVICDIDICKSCVETVPRSELLVTQSVSLSSVDFSCAAETSEDLSEDMLTEIE